MLLQAFCIISKPLVNSNWSYSPETPNLGQIRRFLEPCDLDIGRITLKNNRAPLLEGTSSYASFHHHMWIQTGVTVRKRLRCVVTSVTLTFDLWPWPFAWTLPWSLVITPENFMMIRWWEYSEKGVIDGQTVISQYEQTHNMMQVWTGKLSEPQLPVLTIFWVTGRLGPFDPPFSTYVEFWPLLLGSDVEYWPPFFQAL